MPRVRKGAARAQARKRILRAARGYYGTKHRHKYQAENALVRAGVYRYRDRRRLKRDMRRLWVTRITAACRMRGTRYSVFINGLKNHGVVLNRKMLSQVAIEDPKLFDTLCTMVVKGANAASEAPRLRKSALLASGGEIPVPYGKEKSGGSEKRGLVSASKPGASGDGDILDIEGVGPAMAAKLKKAGITWIRELLERGRTKNGRAEVAQQSGIAEKKILDWVNMADMMRVKGVDGDMAELMHAAGVDTVKELATRVPANLAKKMGECNEVGGKRIAPRVPDESEVAVWIDQAKKLPPMVEY